MGVGTGDVNLLLKEKIFDFECTNNIVLLSSELWKSHLISQESMSVNIACILARLVGASTDSYFLSEPLEIVKKLVYLDSCVSAV